MTATMPEPLVSVVLPCLNEEAAIGDCIQTMPLAGALPVAVAGVQSAWAVAAGAAAPGAPYPTLFISGKVDNVIGLFRSVDKAVSWTRINDDAHQFNLVNVIAADQRVFGDVYIGGGGRGVLHGTP